MISFLFWRMMATRREGRRVAATAGTPGGRHTVPQAILSEATTTVSVLLQNTNTNTNTKYKYKQIQMNTNIATAPSHPVRGTSVSVLAPT